VAGIPGPAGSWAEKFIAAADHVAPVLVKLAAHRGARVIATAGRAGRPLALGAVEVLDYHDPDRPERVRALFLSFLGFDTLPPYSGRRGKLPCIFV
jgi:NADPH:quinone reductase-like Zn-dependent oxidoreductase